MQTPTPTGSQPVLPYATPLGASAMSPNDSMWQLGADLIVRRDADLPGICIKCGQPATVRRVKKLSWVPAVWVVAFIVTGFLALLAYFAVRETGRVSYGLCDRHERVRKGMLYAAWGLGLGAVLSFIVGVVLLDSRGTQTGGALLILGAFVLAIAAFVVGLAGARNLYASKIDAHFIWLRGVKVGMTPAGIYGPSAGAAVAQYPPPLVAQPLSSAQPLQPPAPPERR